jgi:hypothetical protein
MIILTMASAVSLLALQASVNAPRNAFAACIKEADSRAKTEKIKPDAFGDYVRNACAPAGAKLKSALVAFDVKNGIGRTQAAADAQMVVDDTVDAAVRTFKRLNSEVAEVQQ